MAGRSRSRRPLGLTRSVDDGVRRLERHASVELARRIPLVVADCVHATVGGRRRAPRPNPRSTANAVRAWVTPQWVQGLTASAVICSCALAQGVVALLSSTP